MMNSKWITPFMRQCFVTTGVTLNLGGHGISNGFAAVLIPQLRRPGSEIPIDDVSGSWIASVSGFSLFIGNFIIPFIMGKYGRRNASVVSLLPMILGWICIALAVNIPMLIVARLLQGLSMGLGTTLGPVLIGEYTSPKNRGAFLTVITVMISIGGLVVHALGYYLHWQTTAIVCSFIALIDLIIILVSPESPSWLVQKGKYDDCKKVYRWLRGEGEENELQRMIEANAIIVESRSKRKRSISTLKVIEDKSEYIKTVLKRKEFYKPIIIMIHIFTLSQWAGVNILSSYIVDLSNKVIRNGLNLGLVIISLDSQRVLSNIVGVYFIKKGKRRTMLLVTGLLGIFSMLAIALYSYLQDNNMLVYDHPLIGAFLLHMNMISIGIGTLPLSFILAGEVFPLEFRSLAGSISVVFHSISYFTVIKTIPYFFNTIGLHGAYCVYAGITCYCFVIAWWLLPETKDRTLQEIEEHFKGEKSETRKSEELVPLGPN